MIVAQKRLTTRNKPPIIKTTWRKCQQIVIWLKIFKHFFMKFSAISEKLFINFPCSWLLWNGNEQIDKWWNVQNKYRRCRSRSLEGFVQLHYWLETIINKPKRELNNVNIFIEKRYFLWHQFADFRSHN